MAKWMDAEAYENKIGEWEEALVPLALDPSINRWEASVGANVAEDDAAYARAAIDGGSGDAAAAARLLVSPRCATPGMRRRPRPAAGTVSPPKRQRIEAPRADLPRSPAAASQDARPAPPSPMAASRAAAPPTDAAPACRSLNSDVDPSLMSEENAERIVVGIAALLEFMMEDHARVGDSPPAVLGVFECANGGARPTVGNIRAFLGDMAQLCRYTLECNVVALILLIRFFSCQPNLRLSPNTWRRYLLCAIMVAQKFWDDRCLRNIDLTVAWRCVLPDAGALPLRDVNLMECHFLAGLGYDLYIQPAKYGACLCEVLSIVIDNAPSPPQADPVAEPPPPASAAS